MTQEISKHTITILVILTVVISFLGTWTVMNEVGKVHVDKGDDYNTINTQTAAKVGLGINAPPKEIGGGQVSLGVN